MTDTRSRGTHRGLRLLAAAMAAGLLLLAIGLPALGAVGTSTALGVRPSILGPARRRRRSHSPSRSRRGGRGDPTYVRVVVGGVTYPMHGVRHELEGRRRLHGHHDGRRRARTASSSRPTTPRSSVDSARRGIDQHRPGPDPDAHAHADTDANTDPDTSADARSQRRPRPQSRPRHPRRPPRRPAQPTPTPAPTPRPTSSSGTTARRAPHARADVALDRRHVAPTAGPTRLRPATGRRPWPHQRYASPVVDTAAGGSGPRASGSAGTRSRRCPARQRSDSGIGGGTPRAGGSAAARRRLRARARRRDSRWLVQGDSSGGLSPVARRLASTPASWPSGSRAPATCRRSRRSSSPRRRSSCGCPSCSSTSDVARTTAHGPGLPPPRRPLRRASRWHPAPVSYRRSTLSP